MTTSSRVTTALLTALVAILAYQAEPVTATLGWIVVTLLTLSFLASFRKR